MILIMGSARCVAKLVVRASQGDWVGSSCIWRATLCRGRGQMGTDATKRVPPESGVVRIGGPRFVVAGAGDDGRDEARPSRG